ncbi:MAG: glycosyltransferase family 4 protein [Gemmatimonadetes bacterium]|nr:glycosyltransferase family 4 protein [Gemmatimonadota bacterium]
MARCEDRRVSIRVALIYDAVYPYVTGGGERRNYAIAAAAGKDHHIALYGLNYWRKDPSRRLPHCTYVPVARAVPLYTRSGRRSLLEPFIFAFGLFWALLRSREDVWDIASFPYVAVPVARLLSILKRRPLIVTWLEYWGDYWYEYLGPAGIVGKLLEALALRCSPRIVAISDFTKRRLVAAGAAEDRITVVPNGVDIARISAAPASAEPTDLVYVGRLIAHKQVHLLIEALRCLRELRPGATLLVIGDGPERGNLERLAETLGMRESVRFAGQLRSLEEVYAHLKSSRVMVLPSKREGFGTVVLEAWACGIPVVVCDEPENAAVELIDSPLKGRVVASHPASIAAACAELLAGGSSERRDRLQAAAARYDWETISAQVLRVYSTSLRAGDHDVPGGSLPRTGPTDSPAAPSRTWKTVNPSLE